ncbi:MAG TPA: FMN-dependent NADH-azoreductase [Allosphingosinicella sp.]|uniref:FMN-dependent NADH-azoreductase n=1 Tax=Allosphingosinicella sp. TaxID=2823234 RepID=UPI002ED8812B
MANVLVINSSLSGAQSVSNKLTRQFADQLKVSVPSIEVKVRDIGSNPIPHLVPETVAGIRAEAITEAEKEARALSDKLIAELKEADLIVIGAPMYNFGIPSTLKTWFDHVLRARVTFRYTEEGPEGLLGDKRAVVIESRAGVYSEGAATAMDSQEPHLRTLLGFMGITDVSFIRVEGLAFGPEAAAAAVEGAARQLRGIAGHELALAA